MYKTSNSGSRGRRLFSEWENVIKNDSGAFCIHCNTKVSNKIERVKAHLQKCLKYNTDGLKSADDILIQEIKEPVIITPTTSSNRRKRSFQNTACDAGSSLVINVTKKHNQPMTKNLKFNHTLDEHLVKTSATEKNKLDKKVAEFFYSSNTAFCHVESPVFLDLMNEARPGYKSPSKTALSTNLLDEVYEEVEQKLKDEITDMTLSENTAITLIMDSWSSMHNDPILVTRIYTGQNSFLLSAMDCVENTKTAEFCFEIALNNIDECKEKFNKEVFAVCSNNEHQMIQMRKLIQAGYPNIITYGCGANYLNLVEKEVTPKTVLKHIIEIQKVFNHVADLIKQKNGRKPQLPNETRWDSQIDCIETYIANYYIYRDIIKENKENMVLNKIKGKLDDGNLYKHAIVLFDQLNIVIKALHQLQSDNTTLAIATDIWKKLLSNTTIDQYHNEIRNRYNDAIKECHITAFLTSPELYVDSSKSEVHITEDEEEKAILWLHERNTSFPSYFMSLKIRDTDYYPRSMFFEQTVTTLGSRKWWAAMAIKSSSKGIPEFEEFCNFIAKLHSCPANSAGIDKIFSNFSHSWSELRNRLGPEKVFKLVKVRKYLNENLKNFKEEK